VTRPVTAPGRLVAGRYRLLSKIAGGGMGTVWLGRDERLHRQVAIKQVLPPLNADAREAERQRERALREGRIAARLSHPHAISVYDVVLEDGQPWLVMEYLPSRSLAEVLTDDGLLRVDQVAQVGAQVADALAATHDAGIVHRDVKPANVLIGRGERVEGLVKITDFGISHAAGDVNLTQTGQITGTPAFLAPEVAQGEEPRPASDVFSLGATLYTCLEGEPPFGMTENSLQLLHRVAGGEVTFPQHAGALTQPLMRMLAADPAERPTMSRVRDELARLAAGRDGDTTTVLMARTDLRPAPDRKRTARFAAAPPPVPTPVPPIPPPKPVPGTADPGPDDAVEPAAPPEPGPEPEVESDGRRRRRLVPLLIGAAVLLIGIVLAAVLIPGTGGGGGTSAGGTSASSAATGPTTSHPAQRTASSSAAGTSAPPRTSAPPTTPSAAPSADGAPAAGAPTAADVRNFVTGYYALLPGNPERAYALTGPTLQSDESRSNYIAFWHRFSAVRLGPVTATDGSLVAHGTVTYVENGAAKPEQHTFTLVRGQDGRLLMDSDRAG
jgi:serine/threonine protein kinase